MGSIFGKIWDFLSSKKEYRILMLGLDGAGKSTILYSLKLGEVLSCSVPTIGFNYETLEYKNVKFNIWDVGGQDKIRILWKHYFVNTRALIYVVDSSDNDRIDETREILHNLCVEEELNGVPVLVFANKQDMAVVGSKQMRDRLGFMNLKGRDIRLQETCAITGTGLKEGLDWLVRELNKN